MIDPVVVAALVALISAIVKAYLPQFPVSDELINAIIVALLGLFGLEGAKYLFPKVTGALRQKNLLK
jgi:hypothetical protein